MSVSRYLAIALCASLFCGIARAEQNLIPFYLSGSNFLALYEKSERSCLAYVVGVIDDSPDAARDQGGRG
jgi:hypothetical protein